MISFFYSNPIFYNLMLKFVHGKSLGKRYELISKEIGKNKTVFELGCGTCLLADYLDKSCNYIGWDFNKNFINYASKKGVNAKIKNIFDYKNYPKNDVIVIIDVLHHIVPNHEKFLKKVIKKGNKIIVVEPFKIENFLNKLFFKNEFTKRIMILLNRMFGDNDGINNPDTVFEWQYKEKELKQFFKKFKAKKIKRLNDDIIAVF